MNSGKLSVLGSNLYPPHFVGGAELIAHYQARAVHRRGHPVAVFAGDLRPPEDTTVRRGRYEGLPVIRFPVSQELLNSPLSIHRAAVERYFHQVLDEVEPDVVHMHHLLGLSGGLLRIARRRGIRTVVTLHDHWGFCFKHTLLKTGTEVCRDFTRCAECLPLMDPARSIPIRMRNDYLAWQFSHAGQIVTPSRYTAETYVRAGLPLSRFAIVPNGIHVERFARIRKSPRNGLVRFTFIGFLGEHKGLWTLVEAARLLRDHPRFRLHIAGTGHLAAALEQRLDACGLRSAVQVLGRIPNREIGKVYSRTDVTVLPSVCPENQPVSVTEAMACRTPVVASRIGGIPELVEDGHSGFLVEPGNAADLAARMAFFLDHPDRCDEFGARGFELIRGNTFDRRAEQLLRVYRAAA
jgi:glycosyltransferase involved in cell wall biosynthesis